MINLEHKRRYYRVTEGPCHAALLAWRQKTKAIKDQHWDFVKAHGAKGYFPGFEDNVGNAIAIIGLIFEGALPTGWKPKKLKSSVDMTGKKVGWPDQRTAIGKQALRDLKALPLCPSTNSVCDQIGFPHVLKYSGKDTEEGWASLALFETLSAGYIDDTFYISLPDEALNRSMYEAKGYIVEGEAWSPLPGMVEILEEEMDLDFAREKLRRKEEA